jgi:hypothetical protein
MPDKHDPITDPLEFPDEPQEPTGENAEPAADSSAGLPDFQFAEPTDDTPAEDPLDLGESQDDASAGDEPLFTPDADASGDQGEDDDTLDFSSFGAASDADEPPIGDDQPSDSTDSDTDDQTEEEDDEPRPTLLERITSVDPYSVMLGVALVAIVLGAASLFAEWASYGYDTTAEAAKSLRP